MQSKQLNLLSGGAAQSVVSGLAQAFRAESGYEIKGSFSAVGEMKAKFLAGAPADVLILTRAIIEDLAKTGKVLGETMTDLGRVRTGIAVRTGDPLPAITSGTALRAALLAADGIYFPDPQKATAGIHFANVLDKLGIAAEVAPRLRPHPNGNTAMRELAHVSGGKPLGCTQITEIKSTAGVTLVGALPTEFELATVYTAAVCSGAAQAETARRFVALLGADASRALRQNAGYEF